MRFLAWDTSSKAGCIGALEWLEWDDKGGSAKTPRLVSEWCLNVETVHSEKLLWGIDCVLQASGWKLDDVDVFGVGVGPGSFTGLRIGITTARTLANSKNKPLVPISSLEVLLDPVKKIYSGKDMLLVSTTDACKGELYARWGLASASGFEERVLAPEELVSIIRSFGKPWVAVGEGRNRYSDVWTTISHTEIKPDQSFSNALQGRVLARLGFEGYIKGEAQAALAVYPKYLRASSAELKLKSGELRPSPVTASAEPASF